jgi:hypothetical protein
VVSAGLAGDLRSNSNFASYPQLSMDKGARGGAGGVRDEGSAGDGRKVIGVRLRRVGSDHKCSN